MGVCSGSGSASDCSGLSAPQLVYLLVEERLLQSVEQELNTFSSGLFADTFHHKVWKYKFKQNKMKKTTVLLLLERKQLLMD